MYRVFLTNFLVEFADRFETVEAAKAAGISAGYEFSVLNGEGDVVGYAVGVNLTWVDV